MKYLVYTLVLLFSIIFMYLRLFIGYIIYFIWELNINPRWSKNKCYDYDPEDWRFTNEWDVEHKYLKNLIKEFKNNI